jgi:hypothetical protein
MILVPHPVTSKTGAKRVSGNHAVYRKLMHPDPVRCVQDYPYIWGLR